MPMMVLFLMVISLSYQFFFRFNHWVDPQRPNTVYERDNLTGQVHQFDPSTQVSLLSRISGHYPQETLVVSAPTPPSQAHSTPETAVTAMAIAQPVPSPSRSITETPTSQPHAETKPSASATTPPRNNAPVPSSRTATAANIPAVGMVMINERNVKPQTTQNISTPVQQHGYMEQSADFNEDGHTEKITLARPNPAPGSPTEITILSGQREVFFGRGDRLQMLSTQRNGWKDIALVLPNGRQQVYGYDLASQGYEPLILP